MISAAQLANIRSRATAMIEEAFLTTIRIGAMENLPAARWSGGAGASGELAGLLATYDLAIRIRLDVLGNIKIVPEKTTLKEGGKVYRVERVRRANGDPAVVLECKAV